MRDRFERFCLTQANWLNDYRALHGGQERPRAGAVDVMGA